VTDSDDCHWIAWREFIRLELSFVI
jgi:hypothetical protein